MKISEFIGEGLEQSFSNEGFNPQSFFKFWFRDKGKAYFFLFKKNLKVTNIQLAELLALIKAHANLDHNFSSNSREKENPTIQFFTSSEFKQAFSALVKEIFPNKESFFDQKKKQHGFNLLSDLYSGLLKNIVVINPFYCSCAVFLPPHLHIELLKICATSGYIHSCGHNIYIRKIGKSKKEFFFGSLEKHLEKFPAKNRKKRIFTVYAHEDFTRFDRGFSDELQHGLDNTKIFIEKFHMASEDLVYVLKEMEKKFKKTLAITGPGNFKIENTRLRKRKDVEKDTTIWLIMDYSPLLENEHSKKEGYFICYEQLYINGNPFHFFDENKPAWITHTTIPHTLIRGMINISRPFWPKGKKSVLVSDPFLGTGTTLFELSDFQELKPICSDKEPIVRLLVLDNAHFFTSTQKKLLKIIQILGRSVNKENDKINRAAFKIFLELVNNSNLNKVPYSLQFDRKSIKNLESKSFNVRFLFYVYLRALVRKGIALERCGDDIETAKKYWHESFNGEAKKLTLQIKKLVRHKKLLEKARKRGDFLIFKDRYSLGCSFNLDHLKSLAKNDYCKKYVKIKDVLKLKPNSFDVIITDPPYGFNTSNNTKELATFYNNALKTIIGSLRKNGQLILCIPEYSHTGKSIPYFCQKQMITQQIIALAAENNTRIITFGETVPSPSKLFSLPYYWESERALRRSILHFKFSPNTI